MTDQNAGAGARIAIVTGSDSGIGRATAVALAADGFDLGITYSRDKDGAHATAEEVRAYGRRAEVRHLDLTELPGCGDVVEDLAATLGGLHVLVANAGTGGGAPFHELDWDTWRDIIDVDLHGSFVTMQRAAQHMVRHGRGGRIVAVTSVHEHAPRYGMAAYCAAKGGLGLLVKNAALDLAEYGITVNAVAPGEIATPMTGQEDEDPHTERRPGIPLGRPGDAREIAALVAFLASPASSYITGASMVADGGMLLMGPHGGSHIPDDGWRSA